MKTRIVTLVKDNKYITLIGAVHIGSDLYFRSINRIANTSDIVLYEKVHSDIETNLSRMYKAIANALSCSVQHREGYEDSYKWENCDFSYNVISPYLPSNIIKINSLSESEIEDRIKRIINNPIILHIFKFIISGSFLINCIREKSFSVHDLRNYKVITKTIEKLHSVSSISVVYGEGHISHFIKSFKKLGFKVHHKNKISIF